jgi:hypothetical protein
MNFYYVLFPFLVVSTLFSNDPIVKRSSVSKATNTLSDASEGRTRTTAPIPILAVPQLGMHASSSCSDMDDPEKKGLLRQGFEGQEGSPKQGIFEPHLRRVEDDFIRQLHFNTTITRDSSVDTFEIEIKGYLRGKQVLRQIVKVVL